MPSINEPTFGLPPAKRQKAPTRELICQDRQHLGSRIFSPFRTLGLVSPTPVPFTSVAVGKTTFQITTSIGRCLQTYDLREGLGLIFLTRPQTPATITATCAWRDLVLAAWGGCHPGDDRGVWVFQRGRKVAELDNVRGAVEPIEALLAFGSWIVGCCARMIQVWKSATYEYYTTLTPPCPKRTLDARILTGKICNMPTYINKIFVGKHDGSVDIWNLRSGKLLYTIFPAATDTGAVTSLQPTPVLSLLTIAYSNGALVIHNIRTDQSVLQLRLPSLNVPSVTSIAFRTDNLGAGSDGRQAGVMATAGFDSSDITMWDLNNGGRISGILRGAHEIPGARHISGVNKIEFLSGQPVMVSTGMDNTLRSWIFDETPFSPVPRALHTRSGHSAPVSTLKFLATSSDGSREMGKWLLSGSKDHSLRGFSLWKDSQNFELSQGKIKSKVQKIRKLHLDAGQNVSSGDVKAPEVTCMACSLNRDGGIGAAASGPMWANAKGGSIESLNATGWESIVTGHRNDRFARTWFWGKKKAGRWAFATADGTEVKSVAISSCGTFALVGSAGGSIDMFNLQSGIHRQRFPPQNTSIQARKPRPSQLDTLEPMEEGHMKTQKDYGKHLKAVTGLMIDNLNRTVISCGLDGKVKFWNLTSGQLMDELDWHLVCSISGLRYSNSVDLVALNCDDLCIRVIDIETKKLVRELYGSTCQVNDFCMSSNGRWVVAASMDSVIRVWDLPTGRLIDVFQLENTCTSLAVSESGEFLATAHADGVGINLWSNRTCFTYVPTGPMDKDFTLGTSEPNTAGGGVTRIDAPLEENDQSYSQTIPMVISEQLDSNLLTLSITPKSRWQTLLHLDVIKQRNKPAEPPKAPQQAPFFLPSLTKADSNRSNVISKTTGDDGLESRKTTYVERTQIAKLQRRDSTGLGTSQFTSLLLSGRQSGEFGPFIEFLKSLSPAKSDLEIRSLDPRTQGGSSELCDFVSALTAQLKARKDFELVNTWMAVFLRAHPDAVGGSSIWDENDLSLAKAGMTVQAALTEWKVEQEREGRRLAELLGYCRGIVGFLKSIR